MKFTIEINMIQSTEAIDKDKTDDTCIKNTDEPDKIRCYKSKDQTV